MDGYFVAFIKRVLEHVGKGHYEGDQEWTEQYLKSRERFEKKCREQGEKMIFFSGEYDSNTTKFATQIFCYSKIESLSNRSKLGVLGDYTDEKTALVLLSMLRPIIDVPTHEVKRGNEIDFFISLISFEDVDLTQKELLGIEKIFSRMKKNKPVETIRIKKDYLDILSELILERESSCFHRVNKSGKQKGTRVWTKKQIFDHYNSL